MRLTSTLILVLGACGGSALDPGAGDSPGTGTGTLVVTGGAHATPQVPLATDAADFSTEFSVQVALGGTPITTGTVTMTSAAGKVALAFDTQQDLAWHGTQAGYEQVYELDVDTGTDNVHGVRVDGPDVHDITAPAAGASVDSTMAVNLTWSRQDVADDARLDSSGGIFDGVTMPDTGTFAIPPNTFKADKQQTRSGTLRLTRTNHVIPTGAAATSTVDVSVENSVDVIVLADPNAGN